MTIPKRFTVFKQRQNLSKALDYIVLAVVHTIPKAYYYDY